MKANRIILPLALVALLTTLAIEPASGQTTAFTYQGRLTYQGNPANGNWDLTFGLFDAASLGTQIGSTLANLNVAVSNGLFTVTLDFGANAFPGADRWLELGVQTNGYPGPFTTLSPRQPLTPSPYAVTATTAGGGWPTTWAGSAITSAVAEATHATNADNALTATTASGGWPTTWAGSAITSAVAEAAHATNADNATTALSANNVSFAVSNTFYPSWNPNGFISGNQTVALSGDATGSGATSIAVTVNNVRGTLTNSITGNAATATTAGGGWPTTWAGSAITSAVAEAAHATNADNVTGAITDSQLSANVPLLDGTNIFSGTNIFNGVLKNVVGGVEFYMVPQGGIIIWSGAAASIPSGWALCDGTGGTPDLRDRFVVGAGNTYAVAATGGATSHTHDTAIGSPTTSTAGAHTHTTTAGTTGSESAHTHAAGTFATGTGSTGTGTTGSESGHTHSVPGLSGGTLQFARQVDFGSSGSSGGPWIISVFSGTSGSPKFNTSWAGATGTGTSGGGSAHSHSVPALGIPALTVGGTSAAGSAHSHSIPALSTDSQGSHTHTVTIGTITSTSASSLPPYYALCYIMKL